MKSLNQITGDDIRQYVKSLDRKTWIRIGVLSAILVLLGAFIGWPAFVGRAQIKKKISSLQKKIKKTQELLEVQPQLTRDSQTYKKQISMIKDSLFEKEESSLLLGIISRMAQESHVTIISSSPKSAPSKFPKPFDLMYQGAVFDFTLEGTYHDFGSFISKIESYPKLLRIQSYALQPQEENIAKQLANLSITTVTFDKAGAQQVAAKRAKAKPQKKKGRNEPEE